MVSDKECTTQRLEEEGLAESTGMSIRHTWSMTEWSGKDNSEETEDATLPLLSKCLKNSNVVCQVSNENSRDVSKQ